MTEMRPHSPPAADNAGAAARGNDDRSVIERAVGGAGPLRFAAPPVPVTLRGASTAPAEPPAAAPAGPSEARSEPRSRPVRPPENGAVVHRIDLGRLADAGIAHAESGDSTSLEEFRIVKRQLLEHVAELKRRGGGPAAQRLMLSSPHSGEGKTFCAINLALSLAAERESDVLLVDFDLARASVTRMLGLRKVAEAQGGLMDALVEPSRDPNQFILTTDIAGLSVLPGGPPTRSDAEYLASKEALTVLDRLTAGRPGRIVLFDTPPALAATIPAALAKLVGQVVIIVKADTTAQRAISDAAELLGGCPNLHLLLNAARFSPSGRRFGTYYGYRG